MTKLLRNSRETKQQVYFMTAWKLIFVYDLALRTCLNLSTMSTNEDTKKKIYKQITTLIIKQNQQQQTNNNTKPSKLLNTNSNKKTKQRNQSKQQQYQQQKATTTTPNQPANQPTNQTNKPSKQQFKPNKETNQTKTNHNGPATGLATSESLARGSALSAVRWEWVGFACTGNVFVLRCFCCFCLFCFNGLFMADIACLVRLVWSGFKLFWNWGYWCCGFSLFDGIWLMEVIDSWY